MLFKSLSALLIILTVGVIKGQQLHKMEVGVNGLTCSVCSRSVEMSLRKLDFIQSVDMDLEKTQGRIWFKPGSDIKPEEIAQAVKNAGFSVRFLTAFFSLLPDNANENCFTYGKNTFAVLASNPFATDNSTSDEHAFTFIDKEYVTMSEYKKWKTTKGTFCAGDHVYRVVATSVESADNASAVKQR